MTEFQLASLGLREAAIWVSIAVGAGQVGIVWYGIRTMNRSSDERAKGREKHAEALSALIRQADALIRQSDASAAALRELVARTAPHRN